MLSEQQLSKLYSLKRDRGSGWEKPYKPALLLTLIDWIVSGDFDTLASKRAKSAIFLAPLALFISILDNTRAVPLVRKENAHKGRVFFCPHFRSYRKEATP